MTDEYTPSTVVVRNNYASSRHMADIGVRPVDGWAEFDRWLAAHDAELIESLAKRIDFIIPATTTFEMDAAAQRGAKEWLLAKAKEVRGG